MMEEEETDSSKARGASEALDKVREWWKEGAKKGINLSKKELRRRCIEEGLTPPSDRTLGSLRNRWVASAMFAEPRRRSKRSFASAQIFKLGTVFLGECWKWKFLDKEM